jgi:hypothetical protein
MLSGTRKYGLKSGRIHRAALHGRQACPRSVNRSLSFRTASGHPKPPRILRLREQICAQSILQLTDNGRRCQSCDWSLSDIILLGAAHHAGLLCPRGIPARPRASHAENLTDTTGVGTDGIRNENPLYSHWLAKMSATASLPLNSLRAQRQSKCG